MRRGFFLVLQLLINPRRAIADKGFSTRPFALWFACQVPMLALLTTTGLMDPAPGQAADLRGFFLYLAGAALVCAFSMLLGVARSFLALWAGGKRLSPGGAARELMPLNCLYALIEAGYTLMLFLLRGGALYSVLEQLCLFGNQLFYGICLALILYHRVGTGFKRSVAVGLGRFLLSSGWLLLGVLFG